LNQQISNHLLNLSIPNLFHHFKNKKKSKSFFLWLSHHLDALPVIDETGGDHAADDITLAELISGACLVEIPVAENKLECLPLAR
jgi:hypothetical protein